MEKKSGRDPIIMAIRVISQKSIIGDDQLWVTVARALYARAGSGFFSTLGLLVDYIVSKDEPD